VRRRRGRRRGTTRTAHRAPPEHHPGEDGSPKISAECALPLTGERCVHRIVTGLGDLDVTGDGLALAGSAPGVTAGDIAARTGAPPRRHRVTPWPR